MSAATNRSRSVQPWRAACMLKISSNHKHVAVKRHSLTAANKAAIADARIVPVRKDLFLAGSFSVLVSSGALGLDFIENALLGRRDGGVNRRQSLQEELCCERVYIASDSIQQMFDMTWDA